MSDNNGSNSSDKTAVWVAALKAAAHVGASYIGREKPRPKDPKVDAWVKNIRNHPVMAPIIMFFLVLLAIAAVFVAIKEIVEFIPWVITQLPQESPGVN